MVLRPVLALGLAALVGASACSERASAILGRQVGGCAEAVGERAAATAAIDVAEKHAVERDRGRLGELRPIASDGKHDVVTAADLGACDDQSGRRGVVADLADLRARYRVIVERTTARLDETAARPPPTAPGPRREGPKDSKDGDRSGSDRGRG